MRYRFPVMLDVDGWLRGYGAAWEAHDGEAAARLFADDAVYCWGPFGDDLHGRDAIRERWEAVTAEQGEVRFEASELGRDGSRSFVHWQVRIGSPGGEGATELDGAFVLDFGDDGLCTRLQEWWMVRSEGAA